MKINESYLILLILVTITLAYGLYFNNFKESYNVMASGGLKRLGDRLNAKQCQDLCEKSKNCKYAVRDKGVKPWVRGNCWISRDFYQHSMGQKDRGKQVWENTKYIQPEKPRYVRTIGPHIYTRSTAAKKCKSAGLELCHSNEIINHKNRNENICVSAWTKDRRGWWVGRWRGWGCGGHWRKYWNWWHLPRSAAHCCTKYPR